MPSFDTGRIGWSSDAKLPTKQRVNKRCQPKIGDIKRKSKNKPAKKCRVKRERQHLFQSTTRREVNMDFRCGESRTSRERVRWQKSTEVSIHHKGS